MLFFEVLDCVSNTQHRLSLSSATHPLMSLRICYSRAQTASTKIHNSFQSFQLQNHYLSHLLTLCINTQQLNPLKSLLIKHGLIQRHFLLGQFLKSCFHLGAFDIALSTFNAVKAPNLFLQNLMVRCLSNHQLYDDVFSVYVKCRLSGCPSDDYTFPFVIKACSGLGSIRAGKEIHCVVLRNGYDENVVIQTALLDFYAKSGRLGIAHVLFEKFPQPDLISFNALIAGYSLHGFDQEVFVVFKRIFVVGLKPNQSSLANVIPVCTRLGCVDIGQSLHGFALKSGYFGNAVLVPALISMYGFDGQFSAARKLFDNVVEKNVAVWNAMVYACTQNKMPYEALEIFQEMHRVDVQPNLVTFVSVIPSCEISGIIQYGESFHAYVIKYGLEYQVSSLTALVSMYAKLGDIVKANSLFYQIPNKNLLSWNAMLSGYVHNKLWDASLAAFCEMQIVGFSPDAVSVIGVISACSKLKATLLGKSVHAFSIRKDIDSNLGVSNVLMSFYSDCNNLFSSFKLFHKMDSRNVVSWNTMVAGCVRNDEVGKAVDLLHQMQKEGMSLDIVTLLNILPICCKGENLGQGMSLHSYAIKSGFASDVSLVNSFINFYCKYGDLEAGKLLFEAIPRCIVSWNAMLAGYRIHNLVNEVFILFSRLIKEDQRPNDVTLLNLLPICRHQLQGKSIHAFAVRTRILQAPLLTSLILMYASFENMKSCMLIFEMEKERNTSVWNAIISVHLQKNSSEKAVVFFCDMLLLGVQPDNITVLSLISACSQLNSLDLAHSIMAYVIHKGFDKDTVIINALIDLYAKCGNILIARKLFDGFLGRDAVSWSVMINGYNLHGDGEAALRIFSDMQYSGVNPDEFTFSSALSACSHSGLVEQGWMVFKSMAQHGISPRMEQYAAMVNLLGRAGHLNEAYDIIKKLPCKPSISLLDSMLGACRMHGNLELGEKIGMIIFEMYPENAGLYVMLSNMYAAAGRWVDASKVRSNIDGRSLRKVPAFSLPLIDEHCDES